MGKQLLKIPWMEHESSNIDSTFFHEPSHTICVKFKSGGVYTYIVHDQDIYVDFIHAPSLGKYLNNVIKAFPYTRWDSEQALLDHLNLV